MAGYRIDKNRLKKVRMSVKLTQEEFAKKIGVSRNFIAQLESEKKNVSDRTIKDICNKFQINESWLRTGEGGDENMYLKPPDQDRFSLNLQKLSRTDNEFIKHIVNLLAEADPEKLKILEEFIKGISS